MPQRGPLAAVSCALRQLSGIHALRHNETRLARGSLTRHTPNPQEPHQRERSPHPTPARADAAAPSQQELQQVGGAGGAQQPEPAGWELPS